MDEFWYAAHIVVFFSSNGFVSVENRALSQVDFDYAFDEFKPINVKLLDDDPRKTQRTITRWSDIGGMEITKQELIQTVQWRFEVRLSHLSPFIFNFISISIPIIFHIHPFDWFPVFFSMVHRDVGKHFLLKL